MWGCARIGDNAYKGSNKNYNNFSHHYGTSEVLHKILALHSGSLYKSYIAHILG